MAKIIEELDQLEVKFKLVYDRKLEYYGSTKAAAEFAFTEVMKEYLESQIVVVNIIDTNTVIEFKKNGTKAEM